MVEHIMRTEQAVSWDVCLELFMGGDKRLTVVAYAFPNDPPERERLSLQHATMTRLFEGKLYFAPLNEGFPPRRILDIATGTGDWAIEIGDRFPNSQVTATDLSPIQPAEVPPNVTFFVEDSYVPIMLTAM